MLGASVVVAALMYAQHPSSNYTVNDLPETYTQKITYALSARLMSSYKFSKEITEPSDVLAQTSSNVQHHDVKEKQCIIEALYHEARSEGIDGINAVMSVIHNRKQTYGFPETYCKVIQQEKQFSYRDSVKSLKPNAKSQDDKAALAYIEHVADQVVKNKFKPTLPGQVLWYTTLSVKNKWTKTKRIYAKIGNHKFMA